MKILKYSKISQAKIKEIIQFFCLDIESSKTAKLVGVSRDTTDRIYRMIREKIYANSSKPFTTKKGVGLNDGAQPLGEYEIDESYFGARRVRGKRGRGASGKTLVFGVLKRGEHVYTEIVERASKDNLVPIIKDKITKKSKLYSDEWSSYDCLINYGYKKHYRINHNNNEFAKGKNHINGIEGFWGLAKNRLSRFKGIPRHLFPLHLKECEFRYNHRNCDLFKIVLKLMKNNA